MITLRLWTDVYNKIRLRKDTNDYATLMDRCLPPNLLSLRTDVNNKMELGNVYNERNLETFTTKLELGTGYVYV